MIKTFESVSAQETGPIIELKILEPDESKGWRLEYITTTRRESNAYNRAIFSVFQEARLNPFHQLTPDPAGVDATAPGKHWWEALVKNQGGFSEKEGKWIDRPVTREVIEKLIPKIQQKATSILNG